MRLGGFDKQSPVPLPIKPVPFRIPVHMIETLNKVMQVQKQLLQELGHEPTPEEVANEMGLALDKVQGIMKMAQQPISQSPVGDGDDTSFGDFIEDKGAENPYDMTAYSLLREKIIDVLDSLTERERQCAFPSISDSGRI